MRGWDERAPDEVRMVAIPGGHRIATYRFGDAAETLLLLNGGPGLPCDYLREPHAPLADHGYRVIAFDQLGNGRSDKPTDPALWTIGRYAEEVEAVRVGLGLGRVHLLGHSWGGWLAVEYAVAYPDALKTLILSSTCADIPHLVEELDRLRGALGAETVAMMLAHEAAGTLDHPEYQAAITILNHRHVCRLPEWPAPMMRSIAAWDQAIYGTMQGPNEFLYVGNLKDWTRLADMHRIRCPALITVGRHDEITPACALRMRHALPDARCVVFPNSSHTPFYEEPEAYRAALLAFLDAHRGP